MLAGLPMIALTWYVQRTAQRLYTTTPAFTPGGSPSAQGPIATLAVKASPHVSWRRTWIGGIVAVVAFAALVIAFMVLRALGIGPAGSLLAAGKLDQGETLVVADFRGPPGDSTLGSTVAEALRTDLRQSSTLNVMTRATMSDVLGYMKRSPDLPVDFNTARELATREGARAVLDGAVAKLGASYIVSARLVSALEGAELATFSETADSENELIASLGRLSRAVRSRVGESLKDVRAARPLERVTTSSLPALRKYVEGVRLADEGGEIERGLALLDEAVTIDTAFAMAWRKIAVVVGNTQTDRARQMDAATRAFRLRARLSDAERLLTEAYYYQNGPEPDRERAIAAYEGLIEADPRNITALNNAGVLYMTTRQHAKAADRLRRSLDDKRPFGGGFTNLMITQLRLGEVSAVESTQAEYRAKLPGHEGLWEGDWLVRWGRGDLLGADSIARATFATNGQTFDRSTAASYLSGTAYLHGKVHDGTRWMTESLLALYRSSRAMELLLRVAFDSARAQAFFLQQPQQARALVRRALTKTPMAQANAASRPWDELGQLAALMRDEALAREALDGFEKDLPARGSPSPDGERARMRAWVALAAGGYATGIRELREADRTYAIGERRVVIAIADAFDMLGQSDSAIVYYEKFVRSPDPFPNLNGQYLAATHKRLGELYEARAETGRAEAHYQFFLDLFKDADAELQPKVQDVRARMARLRQHRG
jgi:tetratricopeptide (TPR) repeat protein